MNLSNKTMAITGVGGFIGLRMAERALELGMKVKGLEISPAAAGRARKLGVEVLVGNVTDPDAARRLCAGADVVFHTAAIVKEGGSWEEFRRINVEGPRLMANAARDAGARRFVHLSSVMVYGFSFPHNVHEDGPLRGENNPYCQTKIESEEAVMAFHEKGKMEVIIIRPGDVYGPGSVPWVVRPIQMMKRGQFILIDGGKGVINHVYVDNLLDGVLLALEKDVTGIALNLTDGQSTTFAEFFGRLARMAGKAPLRSVPAAILKPIAFVVEKAFALAGREPPISPQAIGFVTRPHPYSIDRARKLLGYKPKVSLDEGMKKTEQWLRGSGMV